MHRLWGLVYIRTNLCPPHTYGSITLLLLFGYMEVYTDSIHNAIQ